MPVGKSLVANIIFGIGLASIGGVAAIIHERRDEEYRTKRFESIRAAQSKLDKQ